ncbi:MAG: hypothetical protein ACOYJ6_09940 [Caulobacterales bacterium]|jgi:hypothetical protein
MGKIAPILLTILLAGLAGFALGRTTAGLTDRIVASSALKVQGCNQGVTQKLHFSDPTQADLLSADTVGASCATAVAVLSLRDAGGQLLYAYAMPLAALQQALPGADPLRAWLQPTSAQTPGGRCFSAGPERRFCLAWDAGAKRANLIAEGQP